MTNDLKFSGNSPVVINYNGSSDDVFAPVRTSSCDINIVSNQILDDLYTARKDEVCVRIEKNIPEYTSIISILDPGNHTDVDLTDYQGGDANYEMLTALTNHKKDHISQRGFFATNENGNFMFYGTIENEVTGNTYTHTFQYQGNKADGPMIWVAEDDFRMYYSLYSGDTLKGYFYDGTHSYMVTENNGEWYISVWTPSGSDPIGGTWGGRTAYYRLEGSTNYYNNYPTSCIVTYLDGTLELIWNEYVYTWDSTNLKWIKLNTGYSDTDGDIYTGMYGEWYHQVKNANGVLVDAMVCNGLDGEDWLVSLDRTNHTFTRMIKLESSDDIYNLFTDDDGELYCIKDNGDIYYWCWRYNIWVKWISFTGTDVTPGTFHLDYVVPKTSTSWYLDTSDNKYHKDAESDSKIVFIYYNDSNMKPRVWVLMDISAPTVGYKKQYITQQVQKWDRGTHRGNGSSTVPGLVKIGSDYYNMTIRYQFVDIDGKLNILCDLEKDSETESYVWLLQDDNQTETAFTRTNKWNLEGDSTKNDYYFYIGTDSYSLNKHLADGYWYVQKWNGSSWDSYGLYCRWNSSNGVSRTTPGSFNPDDIYYHCDGTVELINEGIYGSVPGVYTFYTTGTGNNMRTGWKWVADAYTLSGNDIDSIRGRWCKNVRVFDGDEIKNIDLAYVGYSSSINGLYKMNHTTHTLTKYIESPSDTLYNGRPSGGSTTLSDDKFLLTDSQNNLYMWLRDTSEFVWLAPDGWEHIYWLGGSGYVTNSMYFTYQMKDRFHFVTEDIVPGASNTDWAVTVSITTPPSLYFENEYVYTNQVVWEGYKMPNTYAQDVTQNLDTISLTAIDPVSILKYVTINKIMTKPALVTYKDLIGAALSYVMLHSNQVLIEQSVSYGGTYLGDNGLLDLKCQIANFWDEADEPATLYEVIEEMLRPFCMTLAFAGNKYWIYNQSKTKGERMFDEYQVDVTGVMTYVQQEEVDPDVYGLGTDWKSNNTQPATIQINETYDKVTGTASTMVPNYSKMAIDLVDYTQRDKYDAGWMNVQRNKTKGYYKKNNIVTTDTADHWFYIWNGVYTNADYGLEPFSSPVDWYLNINKMYEYLEGQYTSYGADYGSILNFYGGQNNPTGTGKEQTTEKSVSISKRITAYAADNGFPPELLEFSDLDWTGHVSGGELTLQKQNTSNSKFGSGIVMGDSDRVVYHQMYENIYLNSINNPTLNLDITRSFSRTGIDIDIEPLNYNTADNVTYNAFGNFTGCDTNYLPQPWNASQIVVNSIYFRRYSSGSTIRVTPVWDRRRIDMYIELSDTTVLQFNGKEWVAANAVDENNSFYLLKLMNNEHLFHTDHRYDVIETSDGQHYSLTDEDYTYYTDNNGGVYPDEHGTAHTCSRYKSGLNYWESNVDSCSAGQMSIILPQIEDPAAVVYVDVYNSSMLGMTGSDDIGGSFTGQPFYYALGGGEYTGNVYINFLPKNLSHIKAEHLDLNISISVPESNLGQMFSESDIRYELDSNSNYVEEFETPSFRVNTYNQLVTSSFSYLIFDSALADPGEFIINGEGARPECYTVQAYMNWLNRVRKIYSKTIKPIDPDLEVNNIMKYIASPEIGENDLLILSDSWDLKTNRHSITAIEDHNWDVDYVQTQDAVEIPRMARADRYNLPTAKKK